MEFRSPETEDAPAAPPAHGPGSGAPRRTSRLPEAAIDFFYLQNRDYPRTSALQWVGNRYNLDKSQRDLLHRGVFGQREALARRWKRVKGPECRKLPVIVDGHNVHITVESGLLGRPLLLANDSAMRDTAGLSASFSFSPVSELAVQLILRFLRQCNPPRILFLFDAPMSHSGRLAALYKHTIRDMGLRGDARAVPVPEREMNFEASIVAGSDQAVLNASRAWLDLARCALEHTGSLPFSMDFSDLLMACPPDDFAVVHSRFP